MKIAVCIPTICMPVVWTELLFLIWWSPEFVWFYALDYWASWWKSKHCEMAGTIRQCQTPIPGIIIEIRRTRRQDGIQLKISYGCLTWPSIGSVLFHLLMWCSTLWYLWKFACIAHLLFLHGIQLTSTDWIVFIT